MKSSSGPGVDTYAKLAPSLTIVGCSGKQAKGGPTCANQRRRCFAGREENSGIVACIQELEISVGGIEAQEDGGDIAASRLGALVLVLLRDSGREFFEGKEIAGKGTEGGAKCSRYECGRQTFARHIRDHEEV